MKRAFLILFMFGGYFSQVLGSEKNDEITVFKADVGRLNLNPLRYCDKQYIDFLNNHYGMQCKYNEPFLRVYHKSVPEERQSLQKELVEPITFVPFRYFMKDDRDSKSSVAFKQHNSILLSCSRLFTVTKNRFQIQLKSDFGEMNPQHLLEQFKKTPRCEPGHILDEKGKLLVFVDTTELNKELCREDIVRPVGEFYGYACGKQQYEQWINGYFGDEIKTEQKVKEQALFYSRIKKLLCCSSLAAIIMYTLYQKFYATAS
jgi:hypothetical protein